MKLTSPLFHSDSFSANLLVLHNPLFFFLWPNYLSNNCLMTFCCLLLILIDSSFLFLAVSRLWIHYTFITLFEILGKYHPTYSTISPIVSQSEYFVSSKAICHYWLNSILCKLEKLFFYSLLFPLLRTHYSFFSSYLNPPYNYGLSPTTFMKHFPYYISPSWCCSVTQSRLTLQTHGL